jgi:DNA modification methylase
MRRLKITYKDPATLRPRATNPRTHSPRQIKQIGASIKTFGFITPVLIDEANGIVAGHGRIAAAKSLGMTDIPTVRVDHLTPAQIRAYVIADNRLAENAGWDRKLLAIELEELSLQFDFDVTVTGFETAEIDLLLAEQGDNPQDPADEVPDVDRSKPAISRVGDCWRLENHALICGDALKPETFRKLLGKAKAQMVFVDPPYNVAIAGHVSGLGKVKHREFEMASGEMSPAQYSRFLSNSFSRLAEFSVNGSIHFVCIDWRHLREIIEAGDLAYDELKNLCIWNKTNAGMGSFYRSQHELIFVFKNGTAPHINNIELGRFGRNRSNSWTYAGANSFGKDRDEELAMHPTVKPLALVADAILDCSKRGGIILDSFAGSGTTLLAAEKTGRRGYAIELDPHYVDTIIKRMSEVHGIHAIHQETGLDFEMLRRQRTAEDETNDKTKAAAGRKGERKKRRKSP